MNQTRQNRWKAVALISALTVYAVAVAGFHPYSEDGGVYVAGIEKLLDPRLFPAWTAFVTEHLRFSVFAPSVAGMVRISHLPLGWMLLALYVLTTGTTLTAAWALASRCAMSFVGRAGAVTLLACWLTLPIAGTSLFLMDPYVTARSVSTPLVLLAMAWALDRRWIRCAALLLVAALMHPLMAAYGCAAILTMACMTSPSSFTRHYRALFLLATALAVGLAVQHAAAPESADYLRIEVTRYYWFPFLWQWFEWLGLIAPLALLHVLARGPKALSASDTRDAQLLLIRAMTVLGLIAIAVTLIFSREKLQVHLVARLQPLRSFQLVYVVMVLLLGAWAGEHWFKRHAWRWALLLLTLGGTMFLVQRQIYPASAHMEWASGTPRNAWERAFVWARDNTPVDAVFALDARYITRGAGEDAQCFRAIAQRSAVPDYSKDGGEAAISPWLTDEWVRGISATTGLAAMDDAQRAAHLRPLGVRWVVLESRNVTAWACPYRNEAVMVCRTP